MPLVRSRSTQIFQNVRTTLEVARRGCTGASALGSSLLDSVVNKKVYHDDAWEKSDDNVERPATPWVRTVQSGIELLRNPKYNKGMAFSKTERDRHYLHGLLPPAYMNQDMQVLRVMSNLREYTSDLMKYNHLMALQERNERLFFRVLMDNIEELLPIVYTPTVGLVCQQYGLLFRRPRGLFISIRDRGRVMELLKNWPERRVRVIVVTDGERILGLGDLGVQGMGIPVGKLTLYTAIGGLHPSECLPVTLDVGTNNKSLLEHPFYPGLRQNRVVGEEYDELVDEFMEACKARYGSRVLIQGTAAVALAGMIAALPLTGGQLSDHTFMFNGAGEAGTGIAEMVALYISKEAKITIPEARERIWMVDSKGLVVKSRMDSLQSHKIPFVKDYPAHSTLLECVKAIRPTALIGVSGKAQSFTKEICEAMTEYSQGACVFASGSPFAPVEVDGQWHHPGQGNNAYIFPGFGLGCLVAGTTRIRDEMFLAAAETLAGEVTDEDRKKGLVYPPLRKVRAVSAQIAKAVASKAYEHGVATNLPKPANLLEIAEKRMWTPQYRRYR
ncbi:hypothetical protein AXG93_4620s1220 [Marchantia polymorpha subsp. ruderalis]|uniref:Malic enzyme n=1 Tax=Marchantia polymorpha subsp. ruderalis TaxID=1480154 RepID=A0A176VWW3_MARPO|nr:hypothetical protein AXG93_4620s1220 [Marchantia polymorpha subsp. ruderalis]